VTRDREGACQPRDYVWQPRVRCRGGGVMWPYRQCHPDGGSSHPLHWQPSMELGVQMARSRTHGTRAMQFLRVLIRLVYPRYGIFSDTAGPCSLPNRNHMKRVFVDKVSTKKQRNHRGALFAG
jgi:hypothetical protein